MKIQITMTYSDIKDMVRKSTGMDSFDLVLDLADKDENQEDIITMKKFVDSIPYGSSPKIMFIKRLREITGCSLMVGKAVVDSFIPHIGDKDFHQCTTHELGILYGIIREKGLKINNLSV